LSITGISPAFQLDFGIERRVGTKRGPRGQTLRLEMGDVYLVECTSIKHVCKHDRAFENVSKVKPFAFKTSPMLFMT